MSMKIKTRAKDDTTDILVAMKHPMESGQAVDPKTKEIPTQIPLSVYIAERMKAERRRIFADEARRLKDTGPKDDLGALLSNITQITIPVPPNPLFSIFGKNEIRLNHQRRGRHQGRLPEHQV